MKIKRTVINYIASGLLFTIILYSLQFLWYTFAPLSYWIEYDSITLLDKKQGQIQILHSIRNSHKDTIGDYTYKTYCGGKTRPEWTFTTPNILLQKTDGFKTIVVDMTFPYTLPLGYCDTFVYINLYLGKGYERNISFKTTYQVLPNK